MIINKVENRQILLSQYEAKNETLNDIEKILIKLLINKDRKSTISQQISCLVPLLNQE